MLRSLSHLRGFAFGLIVVAFVCGPAAAQAEVEVTAEWNPPAFGSPVHYVLQYSVDGSPWTTIANPVESIYTFTISDAGIHSIRVAGVDADGIQGPFSSPSPSFPDPPGEPGQPKLF